MPVPVPVKRMVDPWRFRPRGVGGAARACAAQVTLAYALGAVCRQAVEHVVGLWKVSAKTCSAALFARPRLVGEIVD